MAFEGDLTNLGLADIFQTLGMNRQSGTLVVKHGETERRFYFSDEGVSLLTTRSARKFRLGNLLVGMGKLSEADLRVAVLKQERAKETKLGDILIQTGLVMNEDITEACKYQAAEELYDSFNWKSGKFQFLEGANAGPSGGPGPFAEFFFNVTDIVMEAARRSDELAMAFQKIGEEGEFYARKSEDPLPEDQYDRPARLLYQSLDGSLDVSQVFEEFYLSPFDTALAFVVLINNGLVITMDAPSLEAAARPFLDAKDYPRATRLLARAAKLDPANTALLGTLADAQSALGDRKLASKTYYALGVACKDRDQRTEAVESLTKAVEHDSRNLAGYELLMEVHASLDQFPKAEEACREASRLAAEERDFQGSLRLIERGLGLVPGSNGLRLQRGNCLIAMGQREDGLKEMQAVAADMEEAKAERKDILSVYRKLSQLEPDNKSYKAKVDDLVAGEKRREARKKMLRVGAGVGALAVLGALSLLIKTDSARMEEATTAIRGPEGPAREEAEVFLTKIRDTEAPDSEIGMEAAGLLRELATLRSAPERQKRISELENRLDTVIIEPAMAKVKAGDYPGGVNKILEIIPEITDQSQDDIKGDDLARMWTRVQAKYMAVLMVPAEALRDQSKLVKDVMADVGSTDITKVEVERVKEILASAERAIAVRDRADWKGLVASLRTAADGKLMGVETLRLPDLLLALDQMQASFGSLDDLRNRARAEVFQADLRAQYSSMLAAVSEAKKTGRLDEGAAACDDFIARCAELRKQEPKAYFAPVVERLIKGLKLEAEAMTSRLLLRGIVDALKRADEEEKRGNFQASFDILKKTISSAQDVSFSGRALLPLRVGTRPAGARLTLTADLGAGIGETTTDFTTPCTVRYPYQGKTRLEITMPGFDAAVIERTGITGDTLAVLTVDLQRTLLWTTTVGAAVEGRPGVAGNLVLVGTRGGLLRALEAATGNVSFQVDTENLSGISGGILVAGGRAWFGSNDGEAFCVDLAGKTIAWRRPIGTALEKAPVAVGAMVVFGDADGKIHGLAAADGAPGWSRDLGSPVSGQPLAVGDLVLVPLADQRVVALSAADGSVKWAAPLGGPVYGAMASDGNGGVVAGTESSTLVRILVADGKIAWSAEVEGPVSARPALHAGEVVAATTRGTVVRVLLAEGTVKKKVPLGQSLEGGIHQRGETLYLSGSGGKLIAYDLATDTVLWTRSGLGRLLTSPVGNDSVLVTTSADNTGLVVGLKP